jgi:ADP-heptose:LPS heptosyltransferase
MKQIAVLNFGGIGDAILFSPVLQALQSACPDAKVTLFLEHRSRSIAPLLPAVSAEKSAVETVSNIHNRLALFADLLKRLRGGQYDAVISSGSSPFIALLLGASGIPVRVGFATGKLTDKCLTHPAKLDTQRYAADMYAALAQAIWPAHTANPAVPVLQPQAQQVSAPLKAAVDAWPARSLAPRVLIHPGVSLLSVEKNILKGWPVGHWQQLIQQGAAQGWSMLLAGGPDDTAVVTELTPTLAQTPNTHSMIGLTQNLNDLCWLLQQVDVLVCVDSAPMHVAVAVGTPVVAMFGPTDPNKLLPTSATAIAVTQPGLTCQPCLWAVRKTSCDKPVCLDVPVTAMQTAIERVLNKRLECAE